MLRSHRPKRAEILFGRQLLPKYHENYYATFWFDTHGFLLSVCHKPAGSHRIAPRWGRLDSNQRPIDYESIALTN